MQVQPTVVVDEKPINTCKERHTAWISQLVEAQFNATACHATPIVNQFVVELEPIDVECL